MADALYKVAYDEAVRALSEQQATIDAYRSRAGLLFSAAAITTSFLGAQALRGGNASLCSWLALTAFVCVAVALLAILWPRRWDFTVNPQDVIGAYIESAESASIEELHRELSFYMQGSYTENRKGLEKLVVFLQVANVFFVAEVLLWIVAIALAS